ncbi:hypothetical protein EW146_g7062 [Bondarzewia mesenterica]|uniref:Arrestin-like N-terminal domain-containing protein n=1 Tax=Bondarzewia mesenterica TaxID=1095465 RepID=A0A4V3XEC7_9AGAM|nr:hypothetical protein EW146_g7062 [Bondarzewia mesenterica]
MAFQSRPEPMNASPHHSKVKVSLKLSDHCFVAGGAVTGKMEVECRADKGLGIGVIMVELFAVEVRATVDVSWKGENRLVTDQREVDVVESFEENRFDHVEPEGVIIGEHGKIWVQGKVVGGFVVAGESTCVEIQVKNHSLKKSSGLSITLTRYLHLPNTSSSQKQPLQITDTLTTINFRGPEYITHPGTEGLAQLVFDVPANARTVKGGERQGDEDVHAKESLFEVRCTINIRLAMPIGSKDIHLELPVTIVHPTALPPPPPFEPYSSPPLPGHGYGIPSSPPLRPPVSPIPYLDRVPYAYPMTPPPQTYYNQGQPWFLPSQTPQPFPPFSPPAQQLYYYPPPPVVTPYATPPRSSSAEPIASQPLHNLPTGLPPIAGQHPLLPLASASSIASAAPPLAEPEEGKGERASRFTHHLRVSSRHRSVSPQSHRFPVLHAQLPLAIPPASASIPVPISKANFSPSSQHSPLCLSLRNAPPSPHSLSHSQNEVLSPRPIPSPKQTYTVDPFTNHSLTKSERVEQLEKIAAEVERETRDLSRDLPTDLNIDKTLPGPPVPSGKYRIPSSVHPPVGTLFPPAEELLPPIMPAYSELVPVGVAPKTPTLSALSLLKPPRPSSPGGLEASSENALDALERRLLAEVGTRKLDQEPKRPDVRSVLPMSIPPRNPESAVNDSAISSLTLGAEFGEREQEQGFSANGAVGVSVGAGAGAVDGDGDGEHEISDERTQKQGRVSHSHSGESEGGTRGKARSNASSGRSKFKEKARGKEKDRRSGRKKDGKDDEAIKLRKAAKGRVADWLNRIEVDVPPPPVDSPGAVSPFSSSPAVPLSVLPVDGPPKHFRTTSPFDDSAIAHASSSGKEPNIKETKAEREDVSAEPNPRSSGFVPIATIRSRQALQLKGEKPASSSSATTPHVLPTTTNQVISPPASPRARFEAAVRAASPPATNRKFVSPKKLNPAAQARLPVFSPRPVDAPLKYDLRSARGGRGGRVAAVTAIWATAADGDAKAANGGPTNGAPPKPKALLGLPRARPTPTTTAIVGAAKKRPSPLPSPGPSKAASVPAVVSSSLATPMLSSTASLSRPPVLGRSKPSIPRMAAVAETPSTAVQIKEGTRAGNGEGKGELAFGQARLRDLIRKYQGQAA